ncbi:MAG: glycoside hydrolase family 99-like domain-containing protein [Prevotellaceae bacterium]|jgi:hypothetical protein|nr:glycoside hydrolase family 99-like domain-containing protein [Prevotellaceae bacterium]
MRKIKLVIIPTILAAIAVFTACVDEPNDRAFPADKYFHDIAPVPVTEDYVVGAMYNEMSPGYWYEVVNNQVFYSMPLAYTGHPLLGDTTGVEKNGGYYINEDYSGGGAPAYPDKPAEAQGAPGKLLKQQLQWGEDAGIDFFLISWNGKGTDTLLFNYKNTWTQGKPKIAIIFDCGHLLSSPTDSLHTSSRPNYVKTKLLRQLDSLKVFFDEPYYYKVNGSVPLFGLDNYLRVNSVLSLVDTVRKQLGDVYLITPTVTRGNGYTSPEYFVNIKNAVSIGNDVKDVYLFRENGAKNGTPHIPFNAIYEPAMLTDNYSRYGYDNWRRNFFSIIDDNYSYWKQKMESDYNIEFIPSVMPAFDNSKNDTTSNLLRLPGTKTRLLQRETNGSLYDTYANVGKKNAGKNRIILINSWNNYRQGSGLEPTTEYRDSYLEFTRKYFKKN